MGKLGGYNFLGKTGRDDSIVAGADPKYLMVGMTIVWDLVIATVAQVTLPTGQVIQTGRKFLRYGQVMVRIQTGANKGKFGPFDPAAADGRTAANFRPNEVGIVERTILLGGYDNRNIRDDEHKGLIVGGPVYRGAILYTPNGGAASVATGPLEDDLYKGMPTLELITRRYS